MHHMVWIEKKQTNKQNIQATIEISERQKIALYRK